MTKKRNAQKKNKKVQKQKVDVSSLFDVKLAGILEKYGVYITLGLVVIVALFTFSDYVFFDYLYLFKDIGSDTINSYYPNYVHTADYIRDSGIPKWSFGVGMGQSIFPGDIRNPFTIFTVIFGSENVAYNLVFVEILKILVGSSIFYAYLRTMKIPAYPSIIGSLLYAFSGYMILGTGWYYHSALFVFAVFLLFAFEQLLIKKRWVWFPLAVFFLVGPYLYMLGVFLFFYAMFRFFDEKGFNFKGLAAMYLKMAGYGLLGVGLSAVASIPLITNMLFSPRIAGEASLSDSLSAQPVFGFNSPIHYATMILRFFSNDMLGTGKIAEIMSNGERHLLPDFMGWNNYLEAPIFYCGLISLLLFPQVFTLLSRKRKILFGSFAFLWLIPLIFPYFRYAYYLFAGDYYKGAFSMIIPFTMIYFAVVSLTIIRKEFRINIIVLITTTIVLLGILAYPFSPNSQMPQSPDNPINIQLLNPIRLYLIVYAVLLWLMSKNKYQIYAKIGLLVVLCIELGHLSHITTSEREAVSVKEFESKVGYNDYTVDAINYIKSVDSSFFRVNKADYKSGTAKHGSLNDAMVQNYFGTSSYSSFNQLNYIRFLQELGVIRLGNETDTRWAIGVSQRPLLQVSAHVKYNLAQNDNSEYLNLGYKKVAKFGNVNVLKNEYYLPFGYTYSNYIEKDAFSKMSVLQKDITLLRGVVIENEDITHKNIATNLNPVLMDTLGGFNTQILDSLRSKLIEDTLKIKSFTQNEILGEINLTSAKLLYLSIPYDDNWHAEVNGKEVPITQVNIGFGGILLKEGNYSIRLFYEPSYLHAIVATTAISCIIYILLIAISILRNRQKTSLPSSIVK